MALQFPVDKLTLLNSALAECGDNLINVLEDGSDEYNVCSPMYERAIALLLEEGNYGFGTKVWTLTPAAAAPLDTAWDTAFPLPADMIHIIWVKTNQASTDTSNINVPLLYDILAGQLVCNAQGGPPPPSPPVTPAVITMKGVSTDNSDIQSGTPLFVAALQCFVMSGIYRGLHGDKAEAAKMWAAGEQFAQRSRTRYDMQKPKRQFWNSRIGASRRVRRPWPPIGNDSWSGSGTPG